MDSAEREDPILTQELPEENEAGTEELLNLPVVLLRETIVFPHTVLPLQVGRPVSLNAIEAATEDRRTVFLLAQRDRDETPHPDRVYSVGTIANIGQILRLPDGNLQALTEGVARGELVELVHTSPYWRARVKPVEEMKVEIALETEALMRLLLNQIDRFIKTNPNVPEEAVAAVRNINDPGRLADMVAFAPEFTFEQRQKLLEIYDPIKRLRTVASWFSKIVEMAELRGKIHSEVHKGFEKTQQEYQLREQLKAIQRELGEGDPETIVVNELKRKVEEVGMPAEAKDKALKEIERLAQIPFASPETAVIRNYIDWLVSLPWSVTTPDLLDLKTVAAVLEEDHYGLRKVKDRILEYIAVRKLAERMRTPILCFVGPPGVGKTSLGRSIARALGRKFIRLSLGGIRDEAEIRGHRRTYVGAMPGRIIQSIKTAGSKNPVFMLDEIDKIGMDFRGDPSAALLEALDPEFNHSFSDHYLELPFDLSQILFITTANILFTIPPALRDRMEVIELAGYIEEEKAHIAKKFLVPKQLEQHGLTPRQLTFSEMAIRGIIRDYTKEAGVRTLEREIATICRKVTRKIAEGADRPVKVTSDSLVSFLGPVRHLYGSKADKDEIGVATGVAWTEAGGDIITVEVTIMKGKGGLILTGQLGQVMQESARAALSYARSRARDLGLPPKYFEEHTVHIHVPAGAIPKDGPSAGITMACALISVLTGRAVRKDVAMTGEITLRGRILPIGGLKEKILAAHRASLTTFVLPAKNRKDLLEVPPKVLKDLKLVFVHRLEEALEAALLLVPAEEAA